MKKFTVIRGENEWRSLSGRRIYNKNVLISDMGDIHPFKPVPLIGASTVLIKGCNKNFVYYWLLQHRNIFPFLQNLYLHSHPCEPCVIRTLNRAPFKTYVTDFYWSYTDKWLLDQIKTDRFVKISNLEFENMISNFTEEEVIINKQ